MNPSSVVRALCATLLTLAAFVLAAPLTPTTQAQPGTSNWPTPSVAIEICQEEPDRPDCILAPDAAVYEDLDDGTEPWPMTDEPLSEAEALSLETHEAQTEADTASASRSDTSADARSDGPTAEWRRKLLSMTGYSQRNPAWGGDVMQACGATIRDEGCAVTSAAMVIRYFGGWQDPGSLNRCLGKSACPLEWAKVPACSNERLLSEKSFGFSYGTLKTLIDGKRPGIIGVRNKGHWVVSVGYDYEAGKAPPNEPYYHLVLDSYDRQLKRLSQFATSYGPIHRYTPVRDAG